jgi:hypothetical protein
MFISKFSGWPHMERILLASGLNSGEADTA